jgi:glycosyltransferase involved in cell wall biosynthesis
MVDQSRTRLGILFNSDPSWMGGVIYIQNIIRAFGHLDDEDKPEIVLFYRRDVQGFVDGLEYPRLRAMEWDFPSPVRAYLGSWLSGKNQFVSQVLENFDLDALFPVFDFPVRTHSSTKLVSWYADLQHLHYPEFFSRRKRFERNIRLRLILRNADDLVVSSEAVKRDFYQFFGVKPQMNLHTYHFVSVLDESEELEIEDLRQKYHLPPDYYIVCNQFHKHKNHKVVLEAMGLLKQSGKCVHFALTGRFPKDPASPYLRGLNQIINSYDLDEQICFLGLIPRAEQLLLMKYARAIVQPSLFEGWSTVIEDAKSLQAPVIASSLEVNKEQLGEDGNFFDPHDPEALAMLLEQQTCRNISDIIYEPYSDRVKNAAYDLLAVLTGRSVDGVSQKEGM